jgi:hypothetical protein
MGKRALVWLFAGAALSPAQVTFEQAPRPVARGRDPSLAVRASGAVSLLVAEGGDLWLLTSFDGGDSFDERVRVNDIPGEVASQGENSPRLHMHGHGQVYSLWQARAGEAGGSRLRLARSRGWGETFEKSIPVDASGAPASQAFATLNVSPEGRVYAAWLDGRDRGAGHAGSAALYLARSADRGRSFEPSVRVAADVCPCCRPAIAFTGAETVHVAFRGVTAGQIRDIFIATSRDGGARWDEPVLVAEDNWRIHGCPHSGASLAVLGGRLFVSWYTVREGKGAIYYAWSDDGGRRFSPRRLLSDGVKDANHPQLVPAGDSILAVFQGREPDRNQGWGKIGVYYREIGAGGEAGSLVRLEPVHASASYPAIAFGQPDQLFLAWTEPAEESGHRVVLVRGRRGARASGGGDAR